MIAAAIEGDSLAVRIAGSDRVLAWPEPPEVRVPIASITDASSYPDMASLPDTHDIFWSVGRGFRTVPVVPNKWAFGRRQVNGKRFYLAVRSPTCPVLVVSAEGWLLDGVVVSTPEASGLAQRLSA